MIESTQALTGTVHTELFTAEEIREAHALGMRAGAIITIFAIGTIVVAFAITYDERNRQLAAAASGRADPVASRREQLLERENATLRVALADRERELARVLSALDPDAPRAGVASVFDAFLDSVRKRV